MTNLEKLTKLGAYSCAGDLIYNNKVLGTLRSGDLFLTDEGRALLDMDVEEAVVVKETKRKPKAEAPAPAPVDDPVIDV